MTIISISLDARSSFTEISFIIYFFSHLPAQMPRPEVNLDRLRSEIKQRIIPRKHSHKEVLAWLVTQRIVINRKTLQRRIIQWGISRHGPAGHETAVASIQNTFHYTHGYCKGPERSRNTI